MIRFGELVDEASRRFNIIAAGDRERLWTRHLQESMSPALIQALHPTTSVLDVGSGAGFPGIPVAILCPDSKVALVEPRAKKAAFLEKVVLTLGLNHVRVFPETLETVARQNPESHWDQAISRGIRWTPKMVQALTRLLTTEGSLLRFGPLSEGDVRVVPVAPGSERGIQTWRRENWADLTKCR